MIGEEDVLDGRVLGPRLRVPSFSVDREKYRPEPASCFKPERRDLTGIAAMTTAAATFTSTSLGERDFETFAWHVPLVGNVAHSEVRTRRKDSLFDDDLKLPMLVKKDIRDRLSDRLVILIPPTAPTARLST